MSLLGEAERMAKIVNGHKMVEDVQNDNGKGETCEDAKWLL